MENFDSDLLGNIFKWTPFVTLIVWSLFIYGTDAKEETQKATLYMSFVFIGLFNLGIVILYGVLRLYHDLRPLIHLIETFQ